MWTRAHAKAAAGLFDALDRAGIEWLIYRNHLGLPAKNTSKDVDIVVRRGDVRRAIFFIKRELANLGYSHFEHQRFESIWAFTFYKTDERLPLSIKVDLFHGFVWRGATLVTADQMLERSVKYNGFRVPDKTLDGFLLLFKPLISGGIIKEKYFNAFWQALRDDPKGFYSLVRRTFGVAYANQFRSVLLTEKMDAVTADVVKLRRAAWLKSFAHKPIDTGFATIEHFWQEVSRRLWRRSGTFFALIGPDGVGKSTLVEHLSRSAQVLFIRDPEAMQIRHFRPNVIPNLKVLLSGKAYDPKTEEFSNPHRAKPAGVLSSFLRLSYYWLDYVLGYFLIVKPGGNSGKIFLFDRYVYDFLIDPRRSRLRLPEVVRRAFISMTPQPDLVFVLDCSPSIISSRKQELSEEEIGRQLGEYRKLSRLSTRFVRLDAALPPEELAQIALAAVVERRFQKLQ